MGLSSEAAPTDEQWRGFLDTVDRTYTAAEQDQYTSERSLAVSSREMRDLYDDLKRASETQLAHERDKLKRAVVVHEAILEAAVDGVLVTDTERGLVFCSKRLEHVWGPGIGAGDPLERLDKVARVVAEPERFLEETRKVLEDPVVVFQDELRLLDGRTMERSSAPIPALDGGTHGRVWFFRDITVRKDQERQIREMSEERHRFLFEASPLPLWVFDPTTLQFLAVNEAMVRLLGHAREELLAMTVDEVKPASDVPELRRGIEGLRPGSVHHVGVRPYRCKDGRMVDVDITSHAMMFDGRVAQLAIGVDVTQSRRMEEQLRQAQKMEAVGQLAGGVAHDFNNILAVILANSEMAIEQLGDHPVIEDLREIEAAALRAAGLTRQLLTFSRQQPREVKTVALNSVVINLEKMLSRIVGEDIGLSAVLSPQLGSISADIGQLEQVVMNLVVNARDAMPNGGRLSIETSNVELDELAAAPCGVSPGRYVMLAIRDTGCGMSAATRSRIFEPFFTTKPVGKGTGLGLSTVFGIVKHSQGAIAVTSELGVGTTFRVYLPRVHEVEVDPLPPTHAQIAPRRHGRVLVVEDDARLREVLQRRLTSWGYSMQVATTAEHALAVLDAAAEPFQLIMTDLVMPGLDGRSFATQVLASWPDAKILFMSGYSDHAAVKTTAISAAEHFIAKPFTSEQLASAIDRTLGIARGSSSPAISLPASP
jgi:hypothetical protein